MTGHFLDAIVSIVFGTYARNCHVIIAIFWIDLYTIKPKQVEAKDSAENAVEYSSEVQLGTRLCFISFLYSMLVLLGSIGITNLRLAVTATLTIVLGSIKLIKPNKNLARKLR